MSKLALLGVSFGGTLAPHAASRDHRYSVVIAIDGIYSLTESLKEELPIEILLP
jgi:hypothetical protein